MKGLPPGPDSDDLDALHAQLSHPGLDQLRECQALQSTVAPHDGRRKTVRIDRLASRLVRFRDKLIDLRRRPVELSRQTTLDRRPLLGVDLAVDRCSFEQQHGGLTANLVDFRAAIRWAFGLPIQPEQMFERTQSGTPLAARDTQDYILEAPRPTCLLSRSG